MNFQMLLLVINSLKLSSGNVSKTLEAMISYSHLVFVNFAFPTLCLVLKVLNWQVLAAC